MSFDESLDHVVSTYGDHINGRGVWCGEWWPWAVVIPLSSKSDEIEGIRSCSGSAVCATIRLDPQDWLVDIYYSLWQSNNSNHWNSSTVNSLGTKFCYDYSRETVSLCDSLHIYKLACCPPGITKQWTYGDVIAKRRLPCERSQITMRASCMLWDLTMLLRRRRLVFFAFYQFTWVRWDCGFERER